MAEMWLARKRVLNAFLSKWRKEYLNDLTLPKKWLYNENLTLKPGDTVIVKPDTLEKNSWRLGRIANVDKTQAGVVKSVIVRMPNGQSLHRSTRNVALLEPDFTTREKELLKPDLDHGRAGSGSQTLTVPARDGQPELVFQSPDNRDPCHGKVMGQDADLPEKAVTVAADSVSQNQSSGQGRSDAAAVQTRNLRKGKRRKGFYKDLAKGQTKK